MDPDAKTLEVFGLDGETYRFLSSHMEDDLVRAVPFDAVPLALGRLWAR